MDKWFEELDKCWQSLPLHRQHRYTLYVFTAYLLLTAGVISKVWYDTARSDNKMTIEHIENPVLKKKENPGKLQDTLHTILKNEIYERK